MLQEVEASFFVKHHAGIKSSQGGVTVAEVGEYVDAVKTGEGSEKVYQRCLLPAALLVCKPPAH